MPAVLAVAAYLGVEAWLRSAGWATASAGSLALFAAIVVGLVALAGGKGITGVRQEQAHNASVDGSQISWPAASTGGSGDSAGGGH